MPQAIFAYHLGMDAEQYAFFRIPKLLITEPYFRRLSTDAKLLYGLMLDRMSLSMRNGWMDDDGHVYPDNSHVGIVGGRDANGELLIIHCASGYNNVVITGKEGFTSVGRPQYYSD